MRPRLPLALIGLALVATACGHTASSSGTPLRVYDGHVRTSGCADDWFTGVDATARYACTARGYLIEFLRTGETGSVSRVKPSSHMRIDAILETSSQPGRHAVSNPGVVCYVDTHHGYLARLGTGSTYDIIPLGSSDTLASGTSHVVRPLAQANRVVLTCDASGSHTVLSLAVNGKLLVRQVDAGEAAPLVAFGVSGVGQIGSIVDLRHIIATTGSATLTV